MNNYKDWIGKKISRSDIITPRLVDHLKKTIDQNCLSCLLYTSPSPRDQ